MNCEVNVIQSLFKFVENRTGQQIFHLTRQKNQPEPFSEQLITSRPYNQSEKIKPIILASKEKSSIHFHYQETNFRVPNATRQKVLLSQVMAQEKADFNRIDYIFCTDSFLIQLNQTYLNHDTYTDILTFNLAADNEPIAAEIYISIERVKENAGKLGVLFKDEIMRVMIHGLMHLCGYNDGTVAEIKEMRGKEDFYLTRMQS